MKPAGIDSQVKGVSDSVAEEKMYLIIRDITVFTYWVPYIAWLFFFFLFVITLVNLGVFVQLQDYRARICNVMKIVLRAVIFFFKRLMKE